MVHRSYPARVLLVVGICLFGAACLAPGGSGAPSATKGAELPGESRAISEVAPVEDPASEPESDSLDYERARAAIRAEREALLALPRPEARSRLRPFLVTRLRDELIPAWLGTPWAFYGTTTSPGEGEIACGYFVSTLLEHADLRVERAKLAQQASAFIVSTFADSDAIVWHRHGDVDRVVKALEALDPNVYIVGLDYHVGLIFVSEGGVEFCHSSYLGPASVVCQDPRTDPAFVSQVHVLGPVLTDRVLDAWLDQRPILTRQIR